VPSASCAALGDAAAAHVLKKGEREGSGAVCPDDAPFLGSSRSAASCVDLQVQRQHGGETKQHWQRIFERKNVKRDYLFLDGAPRLGSSSRHSRADAAAVAVLLCLSCVVRVAAAQLEACPGAWSTAALSESRSSLAAASLPNQGLAMFAGGQIGNTRESNAVDIFNSSSGRWSTAALRDNLGARSHLAAASLPNQGLAIFAGGLFMSE
jgi:hypothetical protein